MFMMIWLSIFVGNPQKNAFLGQICFHGGSGSVRFLPESHQEFRRMSTSILRVSTSREEWSSVVGNTSGFGVPNLKMDSD